MERWWYTHEVWSNAVYLRELLHRDLGFTDFDAQAVEAILRLAGEGKVQIGEYEGRPLLRDSQGSYPPGAGTWTKHLAAAK